MAITKLVPIVGATGACRAVGQPRSSWYCRHRQSPAPPRPPGRPRGRSPALSPAERQRVLGVLHAERFWDAAPATVYATLLDEASYLNFEHRHSGIALLTPADVHYGHAEQITLARGAVLAAADAARPERFVGKPPHLPEAVWINKPIDPSEAPQQFPG